MSIMSTVVLLLLLATVPEIQSTHFGSFGGTADIVWQGGFESGDTSEYGFKINAASWSVTSSDGGLSPQCGTKFGKVTLKTDDLFNGNANNNRAELEFKPDFDMDGTTGYFGWSMAHDSRAPLKSDGTELVYWETENGYFQTLGFAYPKKLNGAIAAQPLQFRTRGNGGSQTYRGDMEFEADKWYDYVQEIHWSTDASIGYVRLWQDGIEVVPKTFHKTLIENGKSFLHIGIFRIPPRAWEETMYFDCLVYSKSFSPEGCYDDGVACTPTTTDTIAPTSSPVTIPPTNPGDTFAPTATSEPTASDPTATNCACSLDEAWCSGKTNELFYASPDCGLGGATKEEGGEQSADWSNIGACLNSKFVPNTDLGCSEGEPSLPSSGSNLNAHFILSILGAMLIIVQCY